MASNLEKHKNDLEVLVKLGSKMDLDLTYRHLAEKKDLKEKHKKIYKELKGSFEKEYQRFYTEAHAVIRQIIPDRIDEFEKLYKGEPRRKTIDSVTFNIQDWLNGVRSGTNSYTGEKTFNDSAIVSMRFSTQLAILKSLESRFESSLYDIKQLVQADLFDSELATASELVKKGFLRGAGAISGVVLEKHLAKVADNHSIKTRKKNPSISDLNDLLKNDGVMDMPVWRQIQRLGDIRNLCDHNKEREPTKDEVKELVEGVEKITKTLF